MDRHDIPGLTAEDVAEGHKQDMKIQHKYNCNVMTYWFDEKRGTAFCLIEAPDKKSVKHLHSEAHGLVPFHVVKVDTLLVEAFLGRIEDPPIEISKNPNVKLNVFMDSAFRTIMVTELKDTVFIKSKLDDKKSSEIIKTHNDIIQNSVVKFKGTLVKETAEGFIVSFKSVPDSVKSALEIQKKINLFNSQKSKTKVKVAIGLTAGEPVTGKNDLFGDVVNSAKRLCYITDSNQIVLSSTVTEHYDMKINTEIADKNSIKTLFPMDEEFLNRLMNVTEKIWNQTLFNVNDFGKEVGLSKSQLYRKLISLTGHSPSEFIRDFRLRKAVQLIDNHKGNISQVAFETGFNNPSYFTQCFNKKFGILPSEYEASVS